MIIKKLLLCCLVTTMVCFAKDKDSTRFHFSGWGWLTGGRVESSIKDGVGTGAAGRDYDFNKEWLIDFDAGLKCVATLGDNSRARFHFGMTSAYMITDDESFNSAEYLRRRTIPYVIDAAIEKTAKRDAHEFFGEFGYFPVKYNPQAMNLGEYLFRSGTYYGYLNSGFELADKEKLAGIHGRYTYNINEKSNFKADLYFSTDMKEFPVHDFSLSYIFSANFSGFLQLSAGLMHAHLIPVDRTKTTPFYDTILFNRFNPRITDVCTPNYPDTGDTVIYTFKGTKAMGRVTLDPKSLFGGEIFGKEDFKIYCEMAILGLKNYPIWYEDILERWPVMFGINIPTFKLLDVLSIEVEHYANPYLNTAEAAWKFRSPLPYIDQGYRDPHIFMNDSTRPAPITNDDWKWSIYASKKFGHFRISAQIASDHMIRIPYMVGPPTNSKYTEITPRTKDWYWMTRVMYYF